LGATTFPASDDAVPAQRPPRSRRAVGGDLRRRGLIAGFGSAVRRSVGGLGPPLSVSASSAVGGRASRLVGVLRTAIAMSITRPTPGCRRSVPSRSISAGVAERATCAARLTEGMWIAGWWWRVW